MKQTIFRLTYAGLLIAAFLACGAAASFAQDPCTDVAALNAKQDEYDKLWEGRKEQDITKQIANRKAAVNSGKEFLDKFASCPSAKERADWLQINLPKQEATIKQLEASLVKGKLLSDFDAALVASNATDAATKAKGFDTAFSLGKQILAQWPDDYRTVEIVLATIGGDEALIRNNYKYSDDALHFAKMAAADLEANKSFAIEGKGADQIGLFKKDSSGKLLYNYTFANRNAADGWMNLYIGTILTHNGDKAGSLPYLYKATKFVPDSPAAFALIGDYYFDQLAPAVTEINNLIEVNKKENDADKIKANNDLIKSKIAMSNGIAERAMDAYARAYTISTKADYKANMKARIDQIFKVRFTTPTVTLDQWITTAVAKPFVDPTTPIAPIADPEPVKTTGENTTTTTAPATTTPAKTQAPAKTTGTTAAKKPGMAVVKGKSTAKKGGA